MKGNPVHPKYASLIMVYTLSSALSISPLEIYKMPANLVKELLMVHYNMKLLEKEELDRIQKKSNGV